MAKLSIQAGATSQTVNIFIASTASATGAGLTGLVFNSASLTAYYGLPKAAAVSITLATLAAVTSSFSSGGFKEIDATNMPGWYRFDIPDAAIASGRFVAIHFQGAANMAPLPLEIELTGWNNQDAVRGGLTALPNANAEASGGLFTRGSGAGQINQAANGNIDVNAVKMSSTSLTGRDIGANVLLSAGTGTGQLDFTSGVVKANLAQILGTALTETAGQIAAAFKKVFDVASATFTALSVNQTGDAYARLGAPAGASVSADVAAVKSDTTSIISTLSGLAAAAATAVWAAATRTLTAISDSSGVTTLLSRLSSTRAGNLDNLDATVSGVPGATWDVTLASHLTSGTTGAGLNAASSAGDPWATALPGAYGNGTAGKIIGANLDATVSSRTKPADTQAAVTTVTNLTNAPTSGDFTAAMKTSLNAATPSVTVSDKTGFSLSGAGIQAIWDYLTSALTAVGSIGKLLVDNINATISSRSTYAGADTAGTATLLSRIASALSISGGAVTVGTNNDKTGYALTSAYDAAKTALPAGSYTAPPTASQIATEVLTHADGVETGVTLQQAERAILAASAGKLSGAPSGPVVIRDVNDTKNRISATVDADGNRTAVTLNLT